MAVDLERHVRPGDLALGPIGPQQRRRPQAGHPGQLLAEVLEHRRVFALGQVAQEVSSSSSSRNDHPRMRIGRLGEIAVTNEPRP